MYSLLFLLYAAFPGKTSPCAGIAAGLLSAAGEIVPVPHSAIAVNLYQAFYGQAYLFAKIPFNLYIGIKVVAYIGYLLFGKFPYPFNGRYSGIRQYLSRRRPPYSKDMGQPDFNLFVVRYVYTGYSRHLEAS
jgi:hypothetical protein